jgi:UDP-N-acetylmuramate dehydrogenase
MGNGTYDEAIELINLAKNKVKEKFDINLELEIKII